MISARILAGVLAAAMILPASLHAEDAVESGEYYFGPDETRLRRDIVDIRYLYARPAGHALAADGAQDGFVYFGADNAVGADRYWVSTATAVQGMGGGATPPDRPQDIVLWVDWRPDVTTGYDSAQRRQVGRSLTGSEIEHIGVRADLTALLFDPSGTETTAWHVTGALGSTSLSLVGENAAIAGMPDANRGLLWDVGVGWSSGAISLNAGYQSASPVLESGDSIAVLSLGADYAVMPNLSVYGELNVIGDPATLGEQPVGTVFILGTGLSF
ncbi:MAG: hypothetical protein JSU82_06280 [Rhodospirillales bacterium]|nr:MAG: hypothetical protein JSU82_06280 [Rhodospirillales bacterium]